MDINTTDRPYHNEELVLLLGSNMGDRMGVLSKAKDLLEEHFGKAVRASSIFDTEPWGKTDQDNFLNQALVFHVDLRPMRVLDTILDIESKLGRVRKEKWGPRLIDIDVIFFGDLIFEGDHLRIPHPHIPERSFVLEPLNEIIPGFVHPILNKSVSELLYDLVGASK